MYVHNDLVEVRVILFERLEFLGLVPLQDLLLDAQPATRVLIVLFAHEVCDGVLQAGLLLRDTDLLQHPHHQILDGVFHSLDLNVVLVGSLLLEIVRQDHDVV